MQYIYQLQFTVIYIVNSSVILTDKINVQSETKSDCCSSIKRELVETLLELSTAKEIIKMLQEEINLQTKTLAFPTTIHMCYGFIGAWDIINSYLFITRN